MQLICMVVSARIISDAFGRLTKKPQNALLVGRHGAQLNCSTDGENGNLIEWTYDHAHIVWPPCVSQDPMSFVASSPNRATDCNVEAMSLAPGDVSGAYVCSDRKEKAVAMIIQLGLFICFLRLLEFVQHYCYPVTLQAINQSINQSSFANGMTERKPTVHEIMCIALDREICA